MDFKKEILKLPYIFKDPVKFDKKIDPKKLKFGSKIDNSDHQRETYYSVKEIISPEIIVLNNDLKVRLDRGLKRKIRNERRGYCNFCRKIERAKGIS